MHIEVVVFDLKEEKVKFDDCRIQEYKIKHDTAIIKLKLFDDHIDEVNENSSYKISYLGVAKYDYERYLKTTESSTVIIQPDLNIEVGNFSTKVWKLFNQYQSYNPSYISGIKEFHPTITLFEL